MDSRIWVKILADTLPETAGAFAGSDFPLPIKSAILGQAPLDLDAVRRELLEKQSGDIKPLLNPLLLATEAFESAQPDRARFFIPDRKLQSHVFMGSKWRAGWCLVLGGDNPGPFISELLKNKFMVFTDAPDIPDTVFIGDRPTSPIYFLQMMVRYGLIWGRIKPGDDHELGHFLERDLPGFMVIRAALDPLKYAVALGLMKLGAPAVVPPDFPFPYGNRVVAENDSQILPAASGFPNLRQRVFGNEVIALPDYANQAYADQDFPAATILGGTPDSFFCLAPADEQPAVPESAGDATRGFGIFIRVNEKNFSNDIATVVERAALRSASFLDGVRAVYENETFRLELRVDVSLDEDRLKETILSGIRLQYPGIRNIEIRFVRGHAACAGAAPFIRDYRKQRAADVAAMTEANTREFCVCTECRSFSLVHTCILTPDRTPMCNARSYLSVKAAHYFGSDQVPFQRRSEKKIPLRFMFDRGRVIDAAKGEYEGANRIYSEMTDGRLTRVHLHAIQEFPHTSCGCFQNLVFILNGHDGMGIMKRGSMAVTPDGRNWETLANQAGGKQTPGILGVSTQYILSDGFLKGDGGFGCVVWVDSELLPKLARRIRPGQKIATDKDVADIEQLARFLAG